jgi:hypothetical protein
MGDTGQNPVIVPPQIIEKPTSVTVFGVCVNSLDMAIETETTLVDRPIYPSMPLAGKGKEFESDD